MSISLKDKTHLIFHDLYARENSVALCAFLLLVESDKPASTGHSKEEDGLVGKMAIMPISGFIAW